MLDVLQNATQLLFVVVVLWCLVYFALELYVLVWCEVVAHVRAPIGFSVALHKGETMANVLTYSVSAAAPVDGDVVARLLTFVVNGEYQGVTELPATASGVLKTFSVPQDAEVVLTLVDVDDAGNKSEPAVLTFVALDTIQPAQPGSFGVTLISESTTVDVVDVPVVDVPVVDVPVVDVPVVDVPVVDVPVVDVPVTDVDVTNG